jgi:uncharacterized protein YndB with AHSA1/START domain
VIVLLAAESTPAPPEEVWKLLYDTSRFASWWEGVQAVDDRDGRLVFETAGDGPMPQRIRRDAAGARVVVSCLALGIEFQWSLTPHRGGTRIAARCELPEGQEQRAEPQHAALAASLRRLAELAATGVPPARC